jgi:hypothetical protein
MQKNELLECFKLAIDLEELSKKYDDKVFIGLITTFLKKYYIFDAGVGLDMLIKHISKCPCEDFFAAFEYFKSQMNN